MITDSLHSVTVAYRIRLTPDGVPPFVLFGKRPPAEAADDMLLDAARTKHQRLNIPSVAPKLSNKPDSLDT